MSNTNPFNFGPRIGSIDNTPNKSEISGRIIVIHKWRWKYKYGVGKSNPLAPAIKEYYDEYIDVGEPDEPWDPIGTGSPGSGGGGGGTGGGTNPFPGGVIAGYDVGNPLGIGIGVAIPKKIPRWALPISKSPRWAEDFEFMHGNGEIENFPKLDENIKNIIELIVSNLVKDSDVLSALELLNFDHRENPNMNNFAQYIISLLMNHVYISANKLTKQYVTQRIPNGSTDKANQEDDIILLIPDGVSSKDEIDLLLELIYSAVLVSSDDALDAVGIILIVAESLMNSGRYPSTKFFSSILKYLETILDGKTTSSAKLDADGNSYYETKYFRWYPESGKLFIKNGLIEIELKGDWRRKI